MELFRGYVRKGILLHSSFCLYSASAFCLRVVASRPRECEDAGACAAHGASGGLLSAQAVGFRPCAASARFASDAHERICHHGALHGAPNLVYLAPDRVPEFGERPSARALPAVS